MSNESSSDQVSKLQAELDELTRREATFRLKTVKDFFAIEAKQRELTKKIEEQNSYIHQLHVERIEARKGLQTVHNDVEVFTWKLHALEREAGALAALKQSFVWPLVSSFAKKPAPLEPAVPAKEFSYFLHTSPYRLYRAAQFTLRGWLVPKDGQPATAVRVRVDNKTFHGQLGREEPEVIAQLGPQPNNPKPGFEITFDTPAGKHVFSLEAQVANTDWYTVLFLPIWCQPEPLPS